MFDPYGSLTALTFRRVEFTDRMLHLIWETKKKLSLDDSEGAEGLTIRSIVGGDREV